MTANAMDTQGVINGSADDVDEELEEIISELKSNADSKSDPFWDLEDDSPIGGLGGRPPLDSNEPSNDNDPFWSRVEFVKLRGYLLIKSVANASAHAPLTNIPVFSSI
jgi:hypothetical protein